MESIEFSDNAHKVVIAVGTFFVMVYGLWVAKLLRENFQMPVEERGKSTLSALLAPSGSYSKNFSYLTSTSAGLFAALQMQQMKRDQEKNFWVVSKDNVHGDITV